MPHYKKVTPQTKANSESKLADIKTMCDRPTRQNPPTHTNGSEGKLQTTLRWS